MKVVVTIILVAVGVFLALAFSATLDATNTDEFCTSCHSMQWVTEEWKESDHYSNVSGMQAGCADCHVPKSLGPKLVAKVLATKDLWHEILGTVNTKEKFEAHRWQMANVVWDKMRATDSRECRSCHVFDAMDLEEQDRTARKKHVRAEKEGETCIECHQGVAHEEPDEPDEEERALMPEDASLMTARSGETR